MSGGLICQKGSKIGKVFTFGLDNVDLSKCIEAGQDSHVRLLKSKLLLDLLRLGSLEVCFTAGNSKTHYMSSSGANTGSKELLLHNGTT